MSLKVMCAGCSTEERERAESDVRRALGARATGGETWIASVINLQSRWSVTLDGPGIRALNFTAPPGRLVEAIQEALQRKTHAPEIAATLPATVTAKPAATVKPAAAPPWPVPAPPPVAAKPTGTGGPRPNGYECAQCHQRFRVSFEAVPGEPQLMTPVACPHCWHMNHVLVGETAADTSDYRAEKD